MSVSATSNTHPVEALGAWQSIILAEFDGPRSRSMSVQVVGI